MLFTTCCNLKCLKTPWDIKGLIGHTPRRAPHFGGIWESAVKSTKTLLHKTLGTQRLTFEEFTTVVSEVEATLNSRPLVPLDSPSTDGVQVLTPAHFLIGRPLHSLPEKTDVDPSISALRRWNLCQRSSGIVGVKNISTSYIATTSGSTLNATSRRATSFC